MRRLTNGLILLALGLLLLATTTMGCVTKTYKPGDHVIIKTYRDYEEVEIVCESEDHKLIKARFISGFYAGSTEWIDKSSVDTRPNLECAKEPK